MTPIPNSTMDALLARPLDLAGLTRPDQLAAIAVHAAKVFAEAKWLEGCASRAERSPVETHAALRARPAAFLPELHSAIMERAYSAMPSTAPHHFDLVPPAAGPARGVTAATMIGQCEAFRSNPGASLPGARPSAGVAMLDRGHVVDGWITVDGEDLPWAYGPAGVGIATVYELARYVRVAPGVRRGLVVGTHLQADVILPPEVTFVSIATLSATPGPEVA